LIGITQILGDDFNGDWFLVVVLDAAVDVAVAAVAEYLGEVDGVPADLFGSHCIINVAVLE
jgi:hypothetical protein